jgi:CSLREA domain-containing protein
MRVRALLLASAAACLIAAAPAAADTFQVTTTADGNGFCPPARNLQCTLRTAITDANNSTSTSDEIDLPAGTYTLSSQFTQLSLTNQTTGIVGAGAAQTVIKGSGSYGTLSIGAEHIAVIEDVTFSGGNAGTGGMGGNILVGAGATLLLESSRVTGGSAGQGGGIAFNNGRGIIANSLIDNNTAVQINGVNGNGGGIAAGTSSTSTVQITDSTIAGNTAPRGGGIYAQGANSTTTITRSTLSGNTSTSVRGGAIDAVSGSTTVIGSIIGGNLGQVGQVASLIAASNCLGTAATLTTGGYNIDPLADCNFTAATDTTADPVLQALADNGGPTPTMAIAGSSSAINRIPASNTTLCTPTTPLTDQRGIVRPEGAGCDSGAFELEPPTATIDSAPDPVITASTATFTFSSDSSGVNFSCKLDGPRGAGAFGSCVSPVSFGALQPGDYTFTVRTTDAGGNFTDTARNFTVAAVPQAPAPTPTPTPPPTPPPVPVLGKTVVIAPLRGTTLVKLPGAKAFVKLDVTKGIPLGSTVDTRHSEVQITSKAGSVAKFYDGLFKLTQSGGLTTLVLTEQLAPCGKSASIAAKKPKTRKLWGDGSGSFSTKGQYSAATVRGTKWLVEDSCGKTLTRVARGVVSVRDFVKRKTAIVRAPHRYTARKQH